MRRLFGCLAVLALCARLGAQAVCDARVGGSDIRGKVDILSIGMNAIQHDMLTLQKKYHFSVRIIGSGSVKEKGLKVQKDVYYWPEQCRKYDGDIEAEISQSLLFSPGLVVMPFRPPWSAYSEKTRKQLLDYVAGGGRLLVFSPDQAFLNLLPKTFRKYSTEWPAVDQYDRFEPRIYSMGKGEVAVLQALADYRKAYLTSWVKTLEDFECQFARMADFISVFMGQNQAGAQLQVSEDSMHLKNVPASVKHIRWNVYHGDFHAAAFNDCRDVKYAFLNGRSTVVAALFDGDGRLADVLGCRKAIRRETAIGSLKIGGRQIRGGQPVELEVACTASEQGILKVLLRDNFNRVFWCGEYPARSRSIRAVPSGKSLTVLNAAEAELWVDGRMIDRKTAEFTMPENMRKEDFYLFTWNAAVDDSVRLVEFSKALRKAGVDGYTNMGIEKINARGAALADMLTIPYTTFFHNLTLDKIFSDSWVESMKERARTAIESHAPYGGFGFTLGDENYVSPFQEKGHFYDSPAVWKEFRNFLKRDYGSLAKLNAQWDKKYADWEKIHFASESEMLNLENPSAWVDYRRFISERFIAVQKNIMQLIHRELPGAYVGWDGGEQYSCYDGYDLYPMARDFSIVNVYGRYWNTECSHGKMFNGRCVQSFARPDALTGLYMNTLHYPYGLKHAIYSALFSGMKSIWWWNATFVGFEIGALDYDYKPNKVFKVVQNEVGRVKSGLAKVIRHSRPEPAVAAVYYSAVNWQASTLSSGIGSHINNLGVKQPLWFSSNTDRCVKSLPGHEKMHGISNAGHYAFASSAVLQMLDDMQIAARMIDAREVAAGEFHGCRLLILPFVEALSDREAEQIRNFVKEGGVVLADYRCAIRDRHCRFRKNGALDEVFGIRQEFPFRFHKQDMLVRMDDNNYYGVSHPVVFNPEIKLAGGRSFGDGAEPVFIVHSFGKGHAVYLNFDLYEYPELRKQGRNTSIRDFVFTTLNRLIPVRLTMPVSHPETQKALSGVHLYRYSDGHVRYGAVLKTSEDHSRTTGCLSFPVTGYLYDVVNHRGLGYGNRLVLDLAPGEPYLIASYPEQIRNLNVSMQPGVNALRVDIEINGENRARRYGHTFEVTVRNPAGQVVDYLSRPVYLAEGRGSVSLPMALNDAEGRWKVQIRELASGLTAEADCVYPVMK